MIQVLPQICCGLVRLVNPGEIGSFRLLCIDTLMSSRPNDGKVFHDTYMARIHGRSPGVNTPLSFKNHETTLTSSASDAKLREDDDREREVELRRGMHRQWRMLESG